MSDNKVVLPREIGKALEYAQSQLTDDYILSYHAQNDSEWKSEAIPLNGVGLMTIAKALVNGYTVEATPEEKVREYYAEIGRLAEGARERSESDKVSSLLSESCGVVHTLNLLGITIEGVNG